MRDVTVTVSLPKLSTWCSWAVTASLLTASLWFPRCGPWAAAAASVAGVITVRMWFVRTCNLLRMVAGVTAASTPEDDAVRRIH